MPHTAKGYGSVAAALAAAKRLADRTGRAVKVIVGNPTPIERWKTLADSAHKRQRQGKQDAGRLRAARRAFKVASSRAKKHRTEAQEFARLTGPLGGFPAGAALRYMESKKRRNPKDIGRRERTAHRRDLTVKGLRTVAIRKLFPPAHGAGGYVAEWQDYAGTFARNRKELLKILREARGPIRNPTGYPFTGDPETGRYRPKLKRGGRGRVRLDEDMLAIGASHVGRHEDETGDRVTFPPPARNNPTDGEDRILAQRLAHLMRKKAVIATDDVLPLGWWERFARRGYTGRDIVRVLEGMRSRGSVTVDRNSSAATWRLTRHNPGGLRDPESIALFKAERISSGSRIATSPAVEAARARVAKLAAKIDAMSATRPAVPGALLAQHRAAMGALEFARQQAWTGAGGGLLSSPIAVPRGRRAPKMRQQTLLGVELGGGDPSQLGLFRKNPNYWIPGLPHGYKGTAKIRPGALVGTREEALEAARFTAKKRGEEVQFIGEGGKYAARVRPDGRILWEHHENARRNPAGRSQLARLSDAANREMIAIHKAAGWGALSTKDSARMRRLERVEATARHRWGMAGLGRGSLYPGKKTKRNPRRSYVGARKRRKRRRNGC
jgi:hypothetical protein